MVRAEKEIERLSNSIYTCPSCGGRLTVKVEGVRESSLYYVVERGLTCSRCGLKIRQMFYLPRVNTPLNIR